MPRLVGSLIVLLALTLPGCASIIMRPAVDDVRTVALVSVYMNREFYNTRSPLAGEGQAAVASLVEAASRAAFEKLLDREAESDAIDVYDPERTRIISFAVQRYRDQLDALRGWRLLPAERVVRPDVDAVAILELDMAYRFNRFSKITFFGTTLAVPTVSHSLVVVNRRGQVAVNTGPVVRGGGERYEGDTVGMVKHEDLVLKHKNDKAVHSYNLAISDAAEALREQLEGALKRH